MRKTFTPRQTAYFEKLKDPRWQKRRLRILDRDDYTCTKCGDKKKQLQVHHSYYVSGRNPWEYPDWSLTALCGACHKEAGSPDCEEGDYKSKFQEWEWILDFLCNGSPVILSESVFDVAMEISRSTEYEADMHDTYTAILHTLCERKPKALKLK